MAVTFILKNVDNPNFLQFERPSEFYAQKIDQILQTCRKFNNGFVTVSLSRPRKPRSVGDLSQNNLIWKLITIIANEVGDDSRGMEDTENGIKERALSKGYPFRVNPITHCKVPASMTEIDTVQCGYLIDTAYEIISELGIILPPMEK